MAIYHLYLPFKMPTIVVEARVVTMLCCVLVLLDVLLYMLFGCVTSKRKHRRLLQQKDDLMEVFEVKQGPC